jgi:hypothetical protein
MRAAAASARAEHAKAGLTGDELTAAVARIRWSSRPRRVQGGPEADRQGGGADARGAPRGRAVGARADRGEARRGCARGRGEARRGAGQAAGVRARPGRRGRRGRRAQADAGRDRAAVPPGVRAGRVGAGVRVGAAGCAGRGRLLRELAGRSQNRKSADTYGKTGRSEALGINAHGEQGAIDALVHSQGVLSAAKNWDRFIGAFGVKSPDGKLMTWDEAEALARSLREGHNAELPGRGPYVPVRVAPGRYDQARIAEILRGQAPGDAEAPKGVISSEGREALAGRAAGGPRDGAQRGAGARRTCSRRSASTRT